MLFAKDLPPGQFIYTVVGIPLLIGAMLYLMMTRTESFPVVVVVLTVTYFIPLGIAQFRRVKAGSVSPTHRRIEIASPAAPEALFAKLEEGAFGRFRLLDRDARRRVLVLEAPASGWSWGFHIPVFVRDAGIGSTIEVGIMPKTIQHISTVEAWHKKAAAEIERVLKA